MLAVRNTKDLESGHEEEGQKEEQVYIIAVPKYHENLYKHIENEHKWLAESLSNTNIYTHFNKRINTEEDRQRFENLITTLRTEKSEIFIDPEYHSRPHGQSTISYIQDFLKTKGVSNYYTFTRYYHITDYGGGSDDEGINNKKEYIIVPLLIRLKRGKTYDQSKRVVGVNPETGEVIVEKVNPSHFYKEKELEAEEIEEINRKERLDRLLATN